MLKYALVFLGVSSSGSTTGAVRNPVVYYLSRLGKHTSSDITDQAFEKIKAP